MSTVLVVREEYWYRQAKIYCDIMNIDLKEITINIKKMVSDLLETMTDFFNKCVIIFDDICVRLEIKNRIAYTNWKKCIKQEQYYKKQFKSCKINYNVMNHDRRC